MNGKKYQSLIQEKSQLKRGERKKRPTDYQSLKRYDAVQIGNTVKSIYPVAEGISSIKCYVRKEEIFCVIHDDHLAIGHSEKNRLIMETQNKV